MVKLFIDALLLEKNCDMFVFDEEKNYDMVKYNLNNYIYCRFDSYIYYWHMSDMLIKTYENV